MKVYRSTSTTQARTNLNSAGEIVTNIELQDLFSHPSESYLVFEGRLTKNDDTAYRERRRGCSD